MKVLLGPRQRSLYIVHLAMLIFSLGNSIIFTGVWPYLQELDRSVSLEQYGFVVAADALGQMIFSPIFGGIADRLASVRLVSLLCCVTFCLGNVFYACVAVVPMSLGKMEQARMYAMLLARFTVGIGTAINAASRSYVSKATYLSERTTHIALLSLFQTLGFVLGPSIQAALTPIGETGYIIPESTFVIDMYTATGWVSAGTGLLAFILFLPGIFVEHSCSSAEDIKVEDKKESKKQHPRELLMQFSSISVVDGQLLQEYSKASKSSSERPNMLATIASTYNFFSFLFNFVLLETLMTPLAIDQWGWTKEDAIMYLGITMAAGGILSGLCFATIGPLSKKFDERVLLICAGLFPMILGRVCMFPLGSEYLEPNDKEEKGAIAGLINCPYDWCPEIPRITVTQFMIGYVFCLVGYPFCMAICGALFSKVLGPIPQGFWMGVLTTSGSLARVVGPIFVTYIYQEFGTWLLFGLVAATLGVSLFITLLSYKQLVPYEQISREEPFSKQIKFWQGWTGIWQTNKNDNDGSPTAAVNTNGLSGPE